MAFNPNIRITPQTGNLLGGISQIAGGVAEQAQGNLSQFFNDWMARKKAREDELFKIISELKKKAPLGETLQLNANEKIQGLVEEIAQMKSENKKRGSFMDWTDEDRIRIYSKADQLAKEFEDIKKTEEVFKKGEEIVEKDMGNTIDREAFYDLELEFWETGKRPVDEKGKPKQLFQPTPKNYEEEFNKLNKTAVPRKKFVKYQNGQAVYVWTYDKTDAQRRDAAIGLTTSPGLKKGADLMFNNLPNAEERRQAAIGENVDPTEVYLAEKAQKELWQDRHQTRPMTAAEIEKFNPKKVEKDKRTTIQKQGDKWLFYDKPIKLTGYKGEAQASIVSLIYGQPEGTDHTDLYFEVYIPNKKEKKTTAKSLLQGNTQMQSGKETMVEYIPYSQLSSVVEKEYIFDGVDEIVNSLRPDLTKPQGFQIDWNKMNPDVDEFAEFKRR